MNKKVKTPNEFSCDFLVTLLFLAALFLAATAAIIHAKRALRLTPEREAALKAEGAAAFDAKVEAVGGWDKWLEAEMEVR